MDWTGASCIENRLTELSGFQEFWADKNAPFVPPPPSLPLVGRGTPVYGLCAVLVINRVSNLVDCGHFVDK